MARKRRGRACDRCRKRKGTSYAADLDNSNAHPVLAQCAVSSHRFPCAEDVATDQRTLGDGCEAEGTACSTCVDIGLKCTYDATAEPRDVSVLA